MDGDEALKLLRGGADGVCEWNRRLQAGETPPNLSGADLKRLCLEDVTLAGVQLDGADLRGAVLRRANLRGAVLVFARLEGADLSDAVLVGAQLTGADMQDARLVGADLTRAQMIHARLRHANLTGARLVEADLSHASLRGANLASADLTAALLVHTDATEAVFRSANLERANVFGIVYSRRKLICQGIRADGCYGNAIFQRDVRDQDWIETFRARSLWHSVIFWFWHICTDCGRSLTRVWATATCLALAFGVLYKCRPDLLNTERSANSPWTPFYFSFVTFTTLGFGDVSPRSMAGEIVVTIEVVLGYLTLGILVSILANKVARRA